METNKQLVPVNGAGSAVARQEFGKRELEVRHETAATAVATQAAEIVRARCAMAIERPRSWMIVRERLLEACRRPAFAAKARYSKPAGKKKNEETGKWEKQYARGFSIRFAEEAIRAMGNIDVETMVKFDNACQRILRIVVLDIESNVGYPSDVLVEKTVERRQLREGQVAISQRTNSYGDIVFLVEATDDELLMKAGALTSKAIRTNGMRLVPGDIQEECEEVIYATLANEQAKDPKAALKNLLDRLGAIGVSVEQVAEYLGHPVEAMTPDERRELIEIGTAIKEEETTWSAVMQDRDEDKKPATGAPAPTDAAPAAAAPVDTTPARTAADLKAKAKADTAKKTPEKKKPNVMQEAENGWMVDPADTGPCCFEDEGVVCAREGFKYEDAGVSYRCGEHAPPPAGK